MGVVIREGHVGTCERRERRTRPRDAAEGVGGIGRAFAPIRPRRPRNPHHQPRDVIHPRRDRTAPVAHGAGDAADRVEGRDVRSALAPRRRRVATRWPDSAPSLARGGIPHPLAMLEEIGRHLHSVGGEPTLGDGMTAVRRDPLHLSAQCLRARAHGLHAGRASASARPRLPSPDVRSDSMRPIPRNDTRMQPNSYGDAAQFIWTRRNLHD